MSIVFVTDVIHPGGAETFMLRLANALQDNGHEVTIFILYKDRIDTVYAHSVAGDIKIYSANIKFRRVIEIFDGLLRRLKIDFSLLRTLFIKAFKNFIAKQQVDIIHSHLFTSDLIAVKTSLYLKVPVVSTIHGDYSAYDQLRIRKQLKSIFEFKQKEKFILNHVGKIVCICEEQIEYFKNKISQYNINLGIAKVYNGFKMPVYDKLLITRLELGIPDNAFVYCMVARGIPEKGWSEVISAFLASNLKDAYLVLIGGSAFVDVLKSTNQSLNIKFLGKQDSIFSYLNISDVGLFCSKIKTEALPTVIIEYLAAGLPVISTDFEESKAMLNSDVGMAGLLVSMQDDLIVNDLKKAMQTFYNNKALYQNYKTNTQEAFKKFDMKECVKSYNTVYESAKKG